MQAGSQRTALGFLRGLGSLAVPWRVWVGLLVVANLVAPMFFLGSREAKVVLAALLAGALIQMIVYRLRGFVRLLGIGHILAWVPMLWWLAPRLRALDPRTPFGTWLVAVVLLDLASLVIDFADVGRYLAGDRSPAPMAKPGRGGQPGGER